LLPGPRAPEFFAGRDTVADDTAAALRTQAGRRPLDRNLTGLAGDLATRSDQFRTRWAGDQVRALADTTTPASLSSGTPGPRSPPPSR
jgi:MmyB-like transcription regulator ligand binding domain